MRVKLDENVGQRGVAVLTAAGHDVATVFGQALCGTPDAGLLAVCRREERCLVTLDLDFANPIAHPPANAAGIAVLRLPARAGLAELLSALRLFAEVAAARDVTGHLWIVEPQRIREYDPEG